MSSRYHVRDLQVPRGPSERTIREGLRALESLTQLLNARKVDRPTKHRTGPGARPSNPRAGALPLSAYDLRSTAQHISAPVSSGANLAP